MSKDPVVVKRYKNEKKFEKDAKKMEAKGYIVADTTIEDKGRGCARWLTLGLFALLTGSKKEWVVTYRLMT